MNKERMCRLADVVERSAVFDMKAFGKVQVSPQGHTCGTPGCIAGHAMALMADDPDGRKISLRGQGWEFDDSSGTVGSKDVADWLGLTYTEARRLFVPRGADFSVPSEPVEGPWYVNFQSSKYSDAYIEAPHAAAMLRLCAEKGDVQANYWLESWIGHGYIEHE